MNHKNFFVSSLIGISVLIGLQESQAAIGQLTAAVSGALSVDGSGAAEEALAMGEYAHAESLFNNQLNFEKNANTTQRAMLLLGLSEAQLWQGKFSEAASNNKRAMSIITKAFGDESAEYARALDATSWLYQAQNKPDKAEQYANEALQIRRKINPNQNVLAESLEHLAYLLENRHVLDQAEALYKESLQVRQKTTGQYSLPVADLYEKLASIALRRGRATEANALFSASLQIKGSACAAVRPYTPHPTTQNVTYRYVAGAPNCAINSAGGNITERIIGDGVLVEASISRRPSDFAKTCSADIRVINHTRQQIDVLSQPVQFISLAPKVRIATAISGEKLAQDIEKKGESKAKWVKFWGADATTTVTTTIVNPQPGPYYYGSGYGRQPAPYPVLPSGWTPNRRNPWTNTSPTVVTTQVPDYEKRAEALAKAQRLQDDSKAQAQAIRESELGPTTVPPGGTVTGALNFDIDDYTSGILRVPVGNAVFEFHFDRTQT